MNLKIEKKICHDGSEGFECNFEIGKKKFFASLCMVTDGFTNSAEPPPAFRHGHKSAQSGATIWENFPVKQQSF